MLNTSQLASAPSAIRNSGKRPHVLSALPPKPWTNTMAAFAFLARC